MIFGFVVYRCHGNIDFSKLLIITNFSLCPASGEKFHVDPMEESLLKYRLKMFGVALKKLYRITLNIHFEKRATLFTVYHQGPAFDTDASETICFNMFPKPQKQYILI